MYKKIHSESELCQSPPLTSNSQFGFAKNKNLSRVLGLKKFFFIKKMIFTMRMKM